MSQLFASGGQAMAFITLASSEDGSVHRPSGSSWRGAALPLSPGPFRETHLDLT